MNSETRAFRLDSLSEVPNVYYNQALELARAGELAAARDKLVTALTLEPEMVDAHVVLGKVYAQMGEYQQAIACWEAALKLAPDNAAAQAGIAKARELQARRRLLRVGLGAALFVLGILSLQTYRVVSVRFTEPPVDSVRMALQNTPTLRGTRLEVVARGKGMQILGSVDTDEQKQLASAVAESKAKGIPVDVSEVKVRHTAPLAESLTRLLKQVGGEEIRSVSVKQQEGILILSGVVQSASDKQRLEALARALVGVRAVNTSKLLVLGITDYVFQDGDTLWDLAVQFYGNGGEWPRIAQSNPHLPRNLRQIQTGTELKIPPRLAGTAPGLRR